MTWVWLLPAAVLAVGTAVTVGRVRTLERERAHLAASIAAGHALAAAHHDLLDALGPGPSEVGSGNVQRRWR